MIHDANRCLCEDCMDYRDRVKRARRRMGLRPIPQIPPVAATRDAAAGATNSEPVVIGLGLPQHGCANDTLLGGADGPGMASGASVVRDQSFGVQLPGAELTQMSSTAGERLPIPREAAGAVLGQHLHGVHEAHGVSGLPAHAGRHVAASVATGVGAPTVGVAS